MIFFIGLAVLTVGLVLPALLRAADLNGDNLDDSWESQYGITTNVYAATNLVGWWQLNGTNSTDNATDRSGNGITGTLSGFPTNAYGAGLFSNALYFPSNAKVDFPTTNSVLKITNQFTFSTWFQATNNLSQPATIATWSDSATNGWSIGTGTNGEASVTFFDGAMAQVVAGTNSPVNLYNGTWHQVAVTYTTNQVATVYVDGAGEATNTISGWTPGPVSSFSFGATDASTTNNPYALDEARLYNRSLGPQEMTQLPTTYVDLNGSGLTVYDDYIEGLNPLATDSIVTSGFRNSELAAYYDGSGPTLTKTSGDGQVVAASTFASYPLVVHVANGSGTALANAPITFVIASGSDGGITLTSGGTTTTSLSFTTDSSGNAAVYYQSGAENLQNNTISATAVSDAGRVSVSFTVHCGIQSGLLLWLKADAGITTDSSGNISSWSDQTGNYPVTQSSDSNKPSYVNLASNGKPAVRFNGSQWLYNSSEVSEINADMTMIIVGATSITPNSNEFMALDLGPGGGGGHDRIMGYWYDLQIFDTDGSGSTVYGTGVAAPDINTFVTEAILVNPDLTNAIFYRNGTQTASDTLSGIQSVGSGVTIGAYHGTSNYEWQGEIAEVLLYNHKLSSDEFSRVDGYLADKYGLYDPNATWPLSYSSDVQAQITANHWDKAQADAFAAFLATSPAVPAAGLTLWLKADAGVTTDGSGNVSQWADQSVFGNNAVQGDSSYRPTPTSSAINGQPALTFDGASTFLTIPDNASLRPSTMTLLVVAKRTGDSDYGNDGQIVSKSYYGGGSWASPYAAFTLLCDSTLNASAGCAVAGDSDGPAGFQTANNTTYLYSFDYDGANQKFWVNGGNLATHSGAGSVDYGDSSTKDLAIGVGSATWLHQHFNGQIAEILMYNRALTDAERNQAEVYLANKYGLYNANATWPLAYSSDVQALITTNQWDKAHTDAYVAFLATNPPVPASGLSLWLKPDAGLTSSGGNVTAWADQTPNHNDASPGSTPPTVITGGLSGYSAVHFDGSGNNYLAIADNLSLRPNTYTILAVAKENSIGSSQFLISRPYRSSGIFGGWTSPFISYSAMLDQDSSTYLGSYVTTTGGTIDNNGANSYDTNRPHEFSWSYDGTSQKAYYDGHATPSTSTATTGNIDYSGGSANLTIGIHSSTDLRGSDSEPLNGDVYEILVYNRALTNAEKQQAEVYLANKYGLYNPNATWPLSYSTAVQAEITKHQWNKPQADGYVEFQAANATMLTNGLSLWFKADDTSAITQDGSGNVLSWTDETGNFTVSQSNSSNRPTYVSSDLSGKPGLHFSGSQWLSYPGTADPGLKGDMTIISVGETTSPSTQSYSLYLGQNSSTGANRAVGYYAGTALFDTGTVYCSGGTAPTSGTFLAEVTTLDPTLSNATFYQNGAVTGIGSMSGVQSLSAGITMGAVIGGSFTWQGDIVEQLVYDHKLSTAELQQVSLYLANKYGLAYSPAIDITPSGGSYTSSQTVSMTTAISGGTIHYTVDGTQPTVNSPTYSSSITISADALVQAVVTVGGVVASPVAGAQYYINDSGETGLPITPTSFTATSISSTETDLAWTLTGMVNYSAINVYRSTNGGAYVLIAVLPPTATSYDDLSVVAGNSYTYEIGTLNQSGVSDTSASSSITPPAGTTLTITVTTPSGAVALP
jgi:hypothetical protein